MDVPLVQKIADMVASTLDVDGQPPHRQAAAFNKTFTGKSRVFVISCKEFNEMDPQLIHDIYRHRHILVTDMDIGKRVEFNARGLSMLAPLDRVVSVQCQSFPDHSFAHLLIRRVIMPLQMLIRRRMMTHWL